MKPVDEPGAAAGPTKKVRETRPSIGTRHDSRGGVGGRVQESRCSARSTIGRRSLQGHRVGEQNETAKAIQVRRAAKRAGRRKSSYGVSRAKNLRPSALGRPASTVKDAAPVRSLRLLKVTGRPPWPRRRSGGLSTGPPGPRVAPAVGPAAPETARSKAEAASKRPGPGSVPRGCPTPLIGETGCRPRRRQGMRGYEKMTALSARTATLNGLAAAILLTAFGDQICPAGRGTWSTRNPVPVGRRTRPGSNSTTTWLARCVAQLSSPATAHRRTFC